MKLKKLKAVKLHTMTTIYGLAGSGKTSLINTLPGKVLVVDTDKGLASVDAEAFTGDVAECETFDDVIEALELAKDYDSIAIDHMTNVQELCYKHVLAKNNATKMLINHYGEASTMLKGVVDALVDYAFEGKSVLVLSQEKSVNIEEAVGDDVPQQILPNLMESVRNYLVASSRIVAHTERVTRSKIIKGVKKSKLVYQVRLGGNPVFVTKVTRKPNLSLPDVIPNATWELLTGLVDGTTQAKIEKAKEAKGEE